MTRFERGYRAALADVTALLRLYADENMEISADHLLMTPLPAGEPPFTAEQIEQYRRATSMAAIHSAQYHAAQHIAAAIAALPRREA